eukprot:gnl/MRDRNA2_/MRDRNA2_108477_c0_seq1.p1 gnl/MRDRNA2_/MRDRNA2_108477_c0~~gnl/MRDRNA2_/MRDRNA2_108477_c0_seq1.p1  ORF type:complete len:306 (+),score=78.35 gnl/MRDRNA2_/MRDRNA2_108477_c0_seq1:59-919(+)
MGSNAESIPGSVPETSPPPPSLPPPKTETSTVPPISLGVEQAAKSVEGDANNALRQAASTGTVPSSDVQAAVDTTTKEAAVVAATAEVDGKQVIRQAEYKVEKKAEQAVLAELTPEIKHLQNELRKLVAEMLKQRFVFVRMAQFFQRLQLIMNIAMAMLAAITAAGHTSMSGWADPDPAALNTLVVGAMSLQGVLVGLNSYLDFSKVKTESMHVMKGYTSILTKLQAALAEPKPTADTLRVVLKEALTAAEKLAQTLGYTPPKWVIKEAEKAEASAKFMQSPSSPV